MLVQATKGLVLICVDPIADVWQIVKTQCYGLTFCREVESLFQGTQAEATEMYLYLVNHPRR